MIIKAKIYLFVETVYILHHDNYINAQYNYLTTLALQMYNVTISPQESGLVRDLNQAWDLYYHVFRRISRQLPQLTSLELQYVSPDLLNCRDLELAVPGSYVPHQDLIRIAHIQSSLQVIYVLMKLYLFHRKRDDL